MAEFHVQGDGGGGGARRLLRRRRRRRRRQGRAMAAMAEYPAFLCWTGEAGLIPRRQRRAVVHREMQVIVGEERPHTESGHLCRILREYA